MLDPNTLITRSPDCIASEIDGEIVLIDIASSRYFGFNPVGSEIWRLLEQPSSLETLRGAIADIFEGDAARIEQETVAFVELLADRQLVTLS
jgi:hypothetical protein